MPLLVATEKEVARARALEEIDKVVGKLGVLSYLFYWNAVQYPFRDPKVMIPKIDRLVKKFDEFTDEYWKVREKVKEVLSI